MAFNRAAFLQDAIQAARKCPGNASFQYENDKGDSLHRELMAERFYGKVSVGTTGGHYRFTVSIDGDQTLSSPPGSWDQGLEWLTALQQHYTG